MKRNDPGSFGKWLTARLIYYPTLIWNLALGRWIKVRRWWDKIDAHVILGAVPFPSDVEALFDLGVRGVVNTCDEYTGPVDEYMVHGMDQFHMPTIDFTHPSDLDVRAAVEFIDRHAANGDRVYIHCKAGRGRSATVAICWLMHSKGMTAVEAQAWLTERRPHVNQHLPDRPVVQRFEQSLAKDFVKPT
jgi:atypical dual specificity phosphatase